MKKLVSSNLDKGSSSMWYILAIKTCGSIKVVAESTDYQRIKDKLEVIIFNPEEDDKVYVITQEVEQVSL